MTDNEAGADRLRDFEAEVAGLRIKGGSIERERQFTTLGLVLAVVGLVIAVAMAVISGGAADSRVRVDFKAPCRMSGSLATTTRLARRGL